MQLIKKYVPMFTAFSESTTKDLFTIQSEYMLKQLNNVMLRCRALSQIESSNSPMENQLKYFEGVSNELSEITGQEIRLLKYYKNKLIDLLDRNMTKAPLISVSYRLTEDKKISVVSVQNHKEHIHPSHNKELNQYSEGA
ncbi:hypothetical protein [Neptunomonas qingdaonensis]|uniref:hypothetical protein n=1 Tax=Neptunomonas qingdaonensis TaxID=1045558 RepID=UPI0015A6958B|nr:hypothetical protein [Neptunomonas qingdaonensis]